MTLIRSQTVVSYRSVYGASQFTFDVVVDSQSNVSVRNFKQLGQVGTTTCAIPAPHFADVEEARRWVAVLLAESSVYAGSSTWSGETEQTLAIPANTLNNTDYRVVYSTPDGAVLATSDKTLTSFTATAPLAYGTLASPIVVPFTVFVNPGQNTSFGGTLTFTDADASLKSVVLPESAASASSYRVILSVTDFVPVHVTNQTVAGFDVVLGVTLAPAETLLVGFDVLFG